MDSILRLTPRQRAELYQAASQKLGFGEVIIEKDFWVCWTLRQLFTLPGIGEHLIFKGGTSLSKVWRAIARFSEDIDVSLSRDWLGFTGTRDPEKAASGKKQRERIEDLAAACAEKIKSEVLPALRARAVAALGEDGWTIAIDADDPQTLRFNSLTVLMPLSVAATMSQCSRAVTKCERFSGLWRSQCRSLAKPHSCE